MSPNRDIAAAFGAQFDPPIEPVQTLKVNGVPMRDAWMVAVFDREAHVGITAHAYGGKLHAYLEVLALGGGRAGEGHVVARREGIKRLGTFFAGAIKQLKDEHEPLGGSSPQGSQGGEGPGETEAGPAAEGGNPA